jgi:outer membrane receptor for ferrienterochelin and colicins
LKFNLLKNLSHMNKKITSLLLLGTLLTSPSAFAIGQADDPVSDFSAITRYSYDYFAEFGPVTLLDMLQRLPEAQQILASSSGNRRGGGKRGFGSGGDQILINGKRLSGKANNISDTMARISSGNVEEIQLIRGAVEGLDVQSDGLVINIKLEAGISTSSTFWKVGGVYYEGLSASPTFTLSHSGSTGKVEYMFGAERKHWEFNFDRDEEYQDGNGDRTGELFVIGKYTRPSTAFTTNLTYNSDENGTLRINGLYEPRKNDGDEIRIETGDSPFYRFSPRKTTGSKWEIGGDYTRNIEWLGQLKTLFVVNRDVQDEAEDRFDSPDADFNYQSLNKIINRSEKIIRASLTRPFIFNQTVEVGAEAAFNTYDQKFDQLSFSDENTVSEINAADEVEISEKRYEVFAIHNYSFNSKLTLQSSLTTEFSTITADTVLPNGDVSRRQTSFTFPKPRLNLRYDVTDSDLIRLLVEKKVSQLDFQNFVTRWDNGSQQLILGNTAIKPQEEWEFSLAYEHRFAKNLGTIEVQVFHTKFKDYISNIDFSEYADGLGNQITADQYFALRPSDALRDTTDFTAKSGNIDKATGYGVKIKSNIRLGFLGLEGAVINIDYEYSTKKTRDQFTGVWRRFERGADHDLKLGYRHDITEWSFSYGVNSRIRTDTERFYINYYWPTSPYPEVSAFAELTVIGGIKARVEAAQIMGKRQRSTKINYSDHIRFDDISRVDIRETRTAQEFKFSLQGTF